MPELYKNRIPIIARSLNDGFIRGTPDTEPSFGCIERDYDIDPVLMGDSPVEMKLHDPSGYDALFDEQEEQESSLEHLYLRGDKPAFEFLDQNGFPDCWFHSFAHTVMLDLMKQNVPIPKFNAVAGATLLKQLNGGWSGLAMKFGREHGIPVVGNGPGEWPYHSRKGKDTPELRARMAEHKVSEDWYDLGRREWDQKLSDRQLATCGFQNWPAAVDYNAYGHAMCQLRKVRIERGRWGKLTLNSWQGFGYHGLCVIPDDVANPNNAVALRASTPNVR